MIKKISFIVIFSILYTSSYVTASSEPTLYSQAAILIDGNTGQVLFDKNGNQSMHPASITKLMTALLAIETLQPEDTLTFSETSIQELESGSSRIGIFPGETLTVNDALHGLLLMSGNEIANGLAEKTSGSIELFVQEMNTRANELGALNTQFTNPHGLFDPKHQTTAYDMALITRQLITSPYFLEIMNNTTYEIPQTNKSSDSRLLYQHHKMLNTKNDLSIYREDVIAGKVGFTTQSKNTLVTVAQRGSRTLIVVALKAEYPEIYTDTATLLDYGFDYYDVTSIPKTDFSKTIPLHDNGVAIGNLNVALSSDLQVLLPLNSKPEALVYDVETMDMTSVNIYDLAVGEIYGYANLSLNGNLLLKAPLYIESLTYITEDYTPVSDVDDEILNDTTSNNPRATTNSAQPWSTLILFVFAFAFILMIFALKLL